MRSRNRWARLATLGAIVVGLGCSKSPSADMRPTPSASAVSSTARLPESPSATRSAPAPASASVAASSPPAAAPSESVATAQGPMSKIKVELIEPGAEPRRALRYDFKVGRKEIMLMDMSTTIEVDMDGEKQPPTTTPKMRMKLQLTPKKKNPNGDVSYDFELVSTRVGSDTKIPAGIVKGLRAQLKGLEGMSGSAVVSPRGETKEAKVSLPGSAAPELRPLVDNLRQSMSQIASPLPKEPVGAGAKWKISMPVESPTIKLTQSATYSLKTLTGTRGTLMVTLRQKAGKQKMRAPGGPSATLDSLRSSGTGTMRFNLERLVPAGKMNIKSDLAMTTMAQGKKRPMTMSMTVVTELSSPEK